jgi:hypothetical protein
MKMIAYLFSYNGMQYRNGTLPNIPSQEPNRRLINFICSITVLCLQGLRIHVQWFDECDENEKSVEVKEEIIQKGAAKTRKTSIEC